MCRVALSCALLAALAAGARAADPAEWTTLRHDMERTSYSPVRVEPPYRIRYFWVNGGLFRPGVDQLPPMIATWMSKRVQPVTDGKLVFVGSMSDNRLYAFDLSTGKTQWTYDAGGPIVESATWFDGSVFVGDAFGKLHCVDAATGKRNWVFEDPHRGSFMSCPAVAAGLVLIGSRSGYFFALDAKTGELRWELDCGNPVFNSPAVYEGGVYFGDEGMYVRRLNLADGRELWKARVHGWTLRHSAPVISARNGIVIWRNNPILNEGAGAILDKEALTFDPADWEKYQGEGGLAQMMKDRETLKEGEGEHKFVQLRVREVMKEKPQARTTFAFNLADGKEPFLVPDGYASQHADVCPPPVAFPDGRVLGYYRGRWGAMKGVLFASRYMIDIGWLDVKTGLFERLGAYNSIPAPFGIRGDDNARLSVGGDILMGNWGNGSGTSGERGAGALDLQDNQRYVFGEIDEARKYIHAGGVGNSAVAPAITANGTILINRYGTHIVAVESAKEQ